MDFESYPRVKKAWYKIEHKIAQKGSDVLLDADRSLQGHEEAPVHGNANLRNPGEEAWLVHTFEGGTKYHGVYHTEKEAYLAAELWEEEMAQEGKERSGEEWHIDAGVTKVRVEHSVEELFPEMEMEHRESTSFRSILSVSGHNRSL